MSVREGEPSVGMDMMKDRFIALGTTDEEVVIFDRCVDSAWVKSDSAIEREAMI